MKILHILPLLAACLAGPAIAQDGHPLTARFVADRVLVEEKAADGQAIVFFTDTGGGRYITEAAAARLDLELTPIPDASPGGPSHVTTWPELAESSPVAPLPSGPLPVVGADLMPSWAADHDAMLGGAWFADRIWTFDYPNHRLTAESPAWRAPEAAVVLPLGFQVREGARTTHFPRIEVEIDGQTIALLLDTGATTMLTPEALAALDDGAPPLRATSMISDTVFRRWQAAHPDWRVIEAAQTGSGSAMIEVPQVGIGTLTVGPVWFTHRPDPAFRQYMSGMMDAPIEGALGGNAFSDLVMTLDYPGSRAVFTRDR